MTTAQVQTQQPYEALLICPSDTAQKTLDTFMDKIKTTVTQAQGTVRSIQNWGRRRFTYPIKHHKDGVYIYVDFDGSTRSPESLKNLFRVTDIVLRHMIVQREEFVDVPPARKPAGAHEAATPAAAGTEKAPAADSAASPSHSKEVKHA